MRGARFTPRQQEILGDSDGFFLQTHDVASAQSASAPLLGLAVDGHQALREDVLGLRSGVDQVGQLEQLTEPDRLLADRYLTHA